MRLRDGKYECSHCGAVLKIPPGEGLQVAILSASGEPNVRVLILHGDEIHRCIISDPREFEPHA